MRPGVSGDGEEHDRDESDEVLLTSCGVASEELGDDAQLEVREWKGLMGGRVLHTELVATAASLLSFRSDILRPVRGVSGGVILSLNRGAMCVFGRHALDGMRSNTCHDVRWLASVGRRDAVG